MYLKVCNRESRGKDFNSDTRIEAEFLCFSFRVHFTNYYTLIYLHYSCVAAAALGVSCYLIWESSKLFFSWRGKSKAEETKA
ncbi:hypothetical protein S83_069596 [Arachis hypogaea]